MSTRERLMAAAEKLIARDGIGVSLRSITTEAEANSAAVHYHFGSKERLVEATLDRRMAEITARRSAVLAPLDGIDLPPVRSVVAALVDPLAEWTRTESAHYVQFLTALQRGGGVWREILSSTGALYSAEIWAAFERALPELDAELLRFRRQAALVLMLEVLGGGAALETPGAWSQADARSALLDLMVGLLSAPATPFQSLD